MPTTSGLPRLTKSTYYNRTKSKLQQSVLLKLRQRKYHWKQPKISRRYTNSTP